MAFIPRPNLPEGLAAQTLQILAHMNDPIAKAIISFGENIGGAFEKRGDIKRAEALRQDEIKRAEKAKTEERTYQKGQKKEARTAEREDLYLRGVLDALASGNAMQVKPTTGPTIPVPTGSQYGPQLPGTTGPMQITPPPDSINLVESMRNLGLPVPENAPTNIFVPRKKKEVDLGKITIDESKVSEAKKFGVDLTGILGSQIPASQWANMQKSWSMNFGVGGKNSIDQKAWREAHLELLNKNADYMALIAEGTPESLSQAQEMVRNLSIIKQENMKSAKAGVKSQEREKKPPEKKAGFLDRVKGVFSMEKKPLAGLE